MSYASRTTGSYGGELKRGRDPETSKLFYERERSNASPKIKIYIIFFQASLQNLFPGCRKLNLSLILTLLRRSVQRVCGAHLRVIAPGQHSFF